MSHDLWDAHESESPDQGGYVWMLRCTAHAAVRGLFHRAYEPVSSTADSPSMASRPRLSKSYGDPMKVSWGCSTHTDDFEHVNDVVLILS